ncbi:hypothetical protein [Siccirubricoccus sp. G192]|uniref:hypothetical protein n=1 Tax=Siccirubricoccus sp. G192 TaxID=2849651 RepID=UPI001C2C7408|nr:hypothetical protein [Siccirubricoccus sp. G192]MBV1798934.1 hypothetical protein [Siccirubricoccus sp. G192]
MALLSPWVLYSPEQLARLEFRHANASLSGYGLADLRLVQQGEAGIGAADVGDQGGVSHAGPWTYRPRRVVVA